MRLLHQAEEEREGAAWAAAGKNEAAVRKIAAVVAAVVEEFQSDKFSFFEFVYSTRFCADNCVVESMMAGRVVGRNE